MTAAAAPGDAIPSAARGARLGAGALLLALVALAPPAARAANRDGWAALAPPARIAARQIVDLAIGEPPAGVEEFEVLVSLDDGRTWPLRASRELPAGVRIVRWTVPNLAAASARLRLRYRLDGRETLGPASDAFGLDAGPGPAEQRLFHENGWWEGLDAGAGATPAADFGSGAPILAAGAAGEAAALPAPPSLAARTATRAPRCGRRERLDDPIARNCGPAPERFFPLRN